MSNGQNAVVNAGTLVVVNTTGSATGNGAVLLNGGTLTSGATGLISGSVLSGFGPHTQFLLVTFYPLALTEP